MNNIQKFFNDEFKEVRATTIDGQPWFVGKDICDALGDTNHNRSIGRIDDDDKTLIDLEDSMGRLRPTYFINESGIYQMIWLMEPKKTRKNKGKGLGTQCVPNNNEQDDVLLNERVEKLARFKYWITHEVLPTIRKTGGYVADTTAFVDNYFGDADESVKTILRTTLDELAKKNAELSKVKAINEENKPKVLFADTVTNVDNLIKMGDFAKVVYDEMGLGRNKTYSLLRELKFINSNNIPYQKYIDMGIFKVREKLINKGYYVESVPVTMVTGKGQVYLLEKLRRN